MGAKIRSNPSCLSALLFVGFWGVGGGGGGVGMLGVVVSVRFLISVLVPIPPTSFFLSFFSCSSFLLCCLSSKIV